jgi:hypothetical protein
VNNPWVDLVEQNFMTHEKDPSEHILDYRIASSAAQVQRVEQLSTQKFLFLDIIHKRDKGREHLSVDG